MPITLLNGICGIYTKIGGYMEDRDKPKAHKAAGDTESIVELTLDMKLPEESDVRIIDLTDAIDGPLDVPVTAPPTVSPSAETIPTIKATAPPAPSEQEIPHVIEQQAPDAMEQAIPDVIEQEVDAAFDAVQAPVQEPVPEQESIDHDDGLIDRLSDIPRKVDEAMEMAGSDDPRVEKMATDTAEPVEPPAIDADDIAASAAELDSAMAEFDPDDNNEDEDEEIIQLTEIVDIEQLQTADFQLDEGEDEIIELTDIVDPAELRVGAVLEARDDDQILELTDRLDMAELQTDAPTEEPVDEEILELTDIFNPAEIEDAPAHEAPAVPEHAVDAIPPLEDHPRNQESVIRLSEVLSHSLPEDERLPIEQIKMGAEEELAKQTISLEAEDTASALGLDLEKDNMEEGKPLTDREIEAAVERIIQTKYAETIEQLIAKAVEKAVTREIENIKRAMLDGDEPLT
jgi:hypothetical protein